MLFFVYGTLKVGGRFASRFDDLRESSEKGSIENVKMLNLGSFPGVVEGDGTVFGEVHSYKEEEKVLRTFDVIEGYNKEEPDRSFYIRKEVEVSLDTGEKVTATMYFLNPKAAKSYKRVESGVWDINTR